MVVDDNQTACGVFVKLRKIQTLFNAESTSTEDDDPVSSYSHLDDPFVRVDAYPLAFLKTAGNIKATGIPHCFYSTLTKINRSVRENHTVQHLADDDEDAPEHDEDAPERNEDEHEHDSDDSDRPLRSNEDDAFETPSTYQAVKPVSSQFYNYITHRVASRAGRHDSQQGFVTAAISGAFATSDKDEATAEIKQRLCSTELPSETFHGKITSVRDCPSACRAELVYSIDVRALKEPSGS